MLGAAAATFLVSAGAVQSTSDFLHAMSRQRGPSRAGRKSAQHCQYLVSRAAISRAFSALLLRALIAMGFAGQIGVCLWRILAGVSKTSLLGVSPRFLLDLGKAGPRSSYRFCFYFLGLGEREGRRKRGKRGKKGKSAKRHRTVDKNRRKKLIFLRFF